MHERSPSKTPVVKEGNTTVTPPQGVGKQRHRRGHFSDERQAQRGLRKRGMGVGVKAGGDIMAEGITTIPTHVPAVIESS